VIGTAPDISVVLPTHNRARFFLGRAIRSILAQTFQDYELIVVDDASTDDTRGLVRSFDDPRIMYFRLPRCTGSPCTPRNIGFLLSRGEHIAYLDDDNRYLPYHLEVLYSALRDNPEVVGVYGDRRYIRECPLALWKSKTAVDWSVDHLLRKGNFVDTSDWMHRREALLRIGGWSPYLRLFTDWDLAARMARSGFDLARVPLVITEYTWHWGNLGQTLVRRATKNSMFGHIQGGPIVQPGLRLSSRFLTTTRLRS
jgi:glycosyltransferase involved in cell wall biosynthesis